MIDTVMRVHKCDRCAIRCRGEGKPGSLLARFHRWHMTWWPGWRIYQEQLRAKAL